MEWEADRRRWSRIEGKKGDGGSAENKDME